MSTTFEGSQELPEEPLIQFEQVCPICLCSLLYDEETEIYKGNDPRFKDWICHTSCQS